LIFPEATMLSRIYEVRAIEGFEFDQDDVADRFGCRLARENGWSRQYADRVIREYKRFVALAVASTHPVTPSDQVDQAWHLHLLDTQNYRKFCEDVLGRPLDHQPSRGGPAERAKYIAAYEETLQCYRETFGEAPPVDIWPDAERRFGADLLQQRVNLAENWVVPNPTALLERVGPSSPAVRWFGAAAVLVSVAFVLDGWLLSGSRAPGLFVLLAVGWLFSVSLAWLLGRRLDSIADLVPATTPAQAAYLNAGARRAIECSLTKLVARGSLAFDSDARTLRLAERLDPGADLLERRIHAKAKRSNPVPIDAILSHARDLTRELRAELVGLRLLKRRRPLALFLTSIFPALALVHAVTHGGAESPWPLLILAAVTTHVGTRAFLPAGGRTSAGDRLLAVLKRLHLPPRPSDMDTNPDPVAAAAVGFTVGLYGHGVLAQTELSEWSSELASHPASDADASDPSDTGGGCSGGGDGADGGGCSGCGGCGGGCGGCGGE
jgi:uncharacterized protein (TIGR04222 family)